MSSPTRCGLSRSLRRNQGSLGRTLSRPVKLNMPTCDRINDQSRSPFSLVRCPLRSCRTCCTQRTRSHEWTFHACKDASVSVMYSTVASCNTANLLQAPVNLMPHVSQWQFSQFSHAPHVWPKDGPFRSATGEGCAEWLKGSRVWFGLGLGTMLAHLDAAGHVLHLLVPLLEQLWPAHHDAGNPGTCAAGHGLSALQRLEGPCDLDAAGHPSA